MSAKPAPGSAAVHFPAGSARCDIRQRLRAATHDIHVQLDHHPLLAGITKPGYPMASYRQVLLGYFHLYARFEPGLTAELERQHLGFDYLARQKLPWIRADLASFGLDPLVTECLPRAAMAPFAIGSAAQLAGSLYAIEGATLGGQVISRHVQKNLGLTRTAGACFFNGYGDATTDRWSEFEDFMRRCCIDEISQHLACDAAVRTFLIVETTLDEYYDKLCTPA